MSVFNTENKDHNGRDGQNTAERGDLIVKKLKEKGFRITKQRRTLIDIILKNECSSCKEIFYKAVKQDSKIGVATVYRMINTLEEIGAIDRKNMYKLSCWNEGAEKKDFVVTFDDGSAKSFTFGELKDAVESGLKSCGYITGETANIRDIKKLK